MTEPATEPGNDGPVQLRDSAGRLLPGRGASEAGRRGGLASAESRQLKALLGLWQAPENHPYAPYLRMAHEWRDDQMQELARGVAEGRVGPGPASLVSAAALQMAGSRWMFDEAAREDEGRKTLLIRAAELAEASHRALKAASEMAAEEAKARRATDTDAMTFEQRVDTLRIALRDPDPETAAALKAEGWVRV